MKCLLVNMTSLFVLALVPLDVLSLQAPRGGQMVAMGDAVPLLGDMGFGL